MSINVGKLLKIAEEMYREIRDPDIGNKGMDIPKVEVKSFSGDRGVLGAPTPRNPEWIKRIRRAVPQYPIGQHRGGLKGTIKDVPWKPRQS